MNSRLLWFVLASALLHLLIFSAIRTDKSEDKKKPISIELIDKQKETPSVAPEAPTPPAPKPVPAPKTYVEPVKEKVELTDENKAADNKPKKTEKPAEKTQQKKKTEEPPSPSTPQPKQQSGKANPQKSVRSEPSPLKKPDLPKMEYGDKIGIDGVDRETIDKILNPKDIINNIAKSGGGADADGEDSVSMQSVKARYTSYFYKFRRQLYQSWSYPYSSAMRGEQGTVRIKFSIHKNGRITDIQVVKSSGYPDLDNEAVRALRNMGGVPLPDSYDLNVLRVDGFFVYYLSGAVDIY